MSSKNARSFSVFFAFALCVFQICAADAPAASAYLKLWGREPSVEAVRGYDQIDAGALDEAESSFNAALKKDASSDRA